MMIATDFEPYSIVEDRGFRNFVEVLNPNYVLPSRQYIRCDLIPTLYAKAKARLSSMLENIEYVAYNQNMDLYITVTVHFYFESKPKCFVLTTSDIPVTHISENLAEILTTIIAK